MGRKILLVEDDRETAAYLAKGLTQEGHSVEQATNGGRDMDGPPAVLVPEEALGPSWR